MKTVITFRQNSTRFPVLELRQTHRAFRRVARGVGEREHGKCGDHGGVEPARGERNPCGGVHVKHELWSVTAAEMLPAARAHEAQPHVHVEAQHYDDDEEENDDRDQHYFATECVVVCFDFPALVVSHVGVGLTSFLCWTE